MKSLPIPLNQRLLVEQFEPEKSEGGILLVKGGKKDVEGAVFGTVVSVSTAIEVETRQGIAPNRVIWFGAYAGIPFKFGERNFRWLNVEDVTGIDPSN